MAEARWLAVAIPLLSALLANQHTSARDLSNRRDLVSVPFQSKSGTVEFNRQLRQAFVKNVSIDFHEAPLPQVLAKFEELSGLNIRADWDALDNEGMGPHSTVTVSLKELPLRTAFEDSLRTAQLDWDVADNVLWVFPAAMHCDPEIESRIYDVADLVETSRDTDEKSTAKFDDLVHSIRANVKAQWDVPIANWGTITPFEADGIRVLLICQTVRAHLEIEALIESLRAVRDAKSLEQPQN